jgi:hypothetical protein
MSADLLAEFGRLDFPSSAERDHKKVGKINSTIPQDEDTLLFNVSNAHDDAVRVGKKNGLQQSLWHASDDGADVLFDALSSRLTDDEFGDFEDGKLEAAQSRPEHSARNTTSRGLSLASRAQSESLLDIDPSIDPLILPKDSQSNEHDLEWGDFSTAISKEKPRDDGMGISTKPSSGAQVSAINGTIEAEDWEPFKGDEASVSIPCTGNAPGLAGDTSNKKTLQVKNRAFDMSPAKIALSVPPVDEKRPTNIPPPLLLLQLLPQLFETLAKRDLVQDPIQHCNAVLQIHAVASRIVAGHSLRWKRDNILSQNNRVGPAAAGRKGGGMKLAAVDKNEGLKEEREIADVIQGWERHAHKFNSMVQKSGIQRPLMTLSKQLRPRRETGVGVVSSHHACALCGLRREERVSGADFDVNDSFGEFWLEHWGHCDCKGFWQTYHPLLPQR